MSKKLLQSTIVATMLAMISGGVLADLPAGVDRADTFGDSLINLPVDESTVTTDVPEVWFVQIDQAQNYSVDIVGAGKHGDISEACNDMSPNADRVYEYRKILTQADIACGTETTKTKPGDSTGTGGGDVGNPVVPVKLCQWLTPPILLDGGYAMAINPIDIGGSEPYTWQETRRGASTCNPNTGDHASATINKTDSDKYADDLVAYQNNNKRGASWVRDSHYQLFTIANAAPAATQAPNAPEPESPVNEISIGTTHSVNNPFPYSFAFEDDSGAVGAATWYELFIYDKDNKRITSYGSNTTYPNWYKLGVDSQISCSISGPSALGKRICVLKNGLGLPFATGAFKVEIKSYAPNDEFKWWVRGYNALGTSMWSAPGTFVK